MDVDALSEEKSDEESTSTAWRQPEAVFPGSGSEEVTAFLHGKKRRLKPFLTSVVRVTLSTGQISTLVMIETERNVSDRANADAGYNSSGAYVKVTKTRVDGSEDKSTESTKADKIKTGKRKDKSTEDETTKPKQAAT